MSDQKRCACGCGREARAGEYTADCAVPCKCGCGGRARYAYAPGHRPPKVECLRCGKEFAPLASEGGLCSQCRRHIREGRPLERDGQLIHSRKMQAASPDGYRWCSGCLRYRMLKFFGNTQDGHYSRCKPCARKQRHAGMLERRYGITPEQYAQIKAAQGGKCAICQVATGDAKSLAVDHDHRCCDRSGSCGKCVRGLLCSNCNNMLAFARDNPDVFGRAMNYLTIPPAWAVIGKVKPVGDS